MRDGVEIGGGISQLAAAAALAVHDEALDPVRPAERLGRGPDVAGADAGPDVGGGHGHRVGLGDQVDAVDGEAEPGAELTEQVDATRAAVAEPEILAHHDVRGVQPVDDARRARTPRR